MIKIIWRTLLILLGAGVICAALYFYAPTMHGNPLGPVTQQLRLTIASRPGHDNNGVGGQSGNNLGDPGRNGGGKGNGQGDLERTSANNASSPGNMLLPFGVTINHVIQIVLITLLVVAIQGLIHRVSMRRKATRSVA